MKLPAILGELNPFPAVFAASAAAAATAGRAGADLQPRLAIPEQLQDFWCWAAVTEGVMRFYDPAERRAQCDVATLCLGQPGGCCGSLTGGVCDKTYFLDRSLGAVGCLAQFVFARRPFSQIASEIDAGHPVCVRIQWPDSGGHFVVISGWADEGEELVTVLDPRTGVAETMTFKRLQTRYSRLKGRWTHTYLTKPPASPAAGAPPALTLANAVRGLAAVGG